MHETMIGILSSQSPKSGDGQSLMVINLILIWLVSTSWHAACFKIVTKRRWRNALTPNKPNNIVKTATLRETRKTPRDGIAYKTIRAQLW